MAPPARAPSGKDFLTATGAPPHSIPTGAGRAGAIQTFDVLYQIQHHCTGTFDASQTPNANMVLRQRNLSLHYREDIGGRKKQILRAIAPPPPVLPSPAARRDLTGGYYDLRRRELLFRCRSMVSGSDGRPGQIDLYASWGCRASSATPSPAWTTRLRHAQRQQHRRLPHGQQQRARRRHSGGSWDCIGWWDSSLEALNAALGPDQNAPVFFFPTTRRLR